jgi:hypothetical protein
VRAEHARVAWLDLRAPHPLWAGATVHRVVYCTALIDGATNPSGHADQDVYLKALRGSGSVDHIEHGYHVSRIKAAPLATRDRKGVRC